LSSDWPKEIVDFEVFLEDAGLVCRRCVYPDAFGNKILDCRGSRIAARAVSDRGRWRVEVADAARPDEWYDAAILRDLLRGRGPDALSLADKLQIIEENWPAIVACFDRTRRGGTHARLAALRKERLKRILPGLFPRKD
jgi:hypothetical protein